MASRSSGGRMSITLFSVALLSLALLGAAYAQDRVEASPPKRHIGQTASAAASAASTMATTAGAGYGVQFRLAYCPPGKFLMRTEFGGGEGASRETTLTHGYYMAVCQLTDEQFVALLGVDELAAVAYHSNTTAHLRFGNSGVVVSGWR